VHAAAADFGAAIDAAERAQRLYREAGNRAAVERCETRLAAFRAGRPLRLPLAADE